MVLRYQKLTVVIQNSQLKFHPFHSGRELAAGNQHTGGTLTFRIPLQRQWRQVNNPSHHCITWLSKLPWDLQFPSLSNSGRTTEGFQDT